MCNFSFGWYRTVANGNWIALASDSLVNALAIPKVYKIREEEEH